MYVNRFLKGKWLKRALHFADNHKKLRILLQVLPSHWGKQGLVEVRESLELMYHYLTDVLSGKYREYNRGNLVVIIGALLYVVSPFDTIVDFIPFGLVDDAAIILWAIEKAKDELERYTQRKESPTL